MRPSAHTSAGCGNNAFAFSPLGSRNLLHISWCQMHNCLAFLPKQCFYGAGWADANVAFMRSGGYSLSRRIQDISQPTLVLWGENDEILDPANAQHFGQELPKSRIVMIPECGHCAHLEKPQAMASAILDFLET